MLPQQPCASTWARDEPLRIATFSPSPLNRFRAVLLDRMNLSAMGELPGTSGDSVARGEPVGHGRV
jgi:hypothetical protein